MSKKKKEQKPKAFVCYEISPHEWRSIHTVYEVHVATTVKDALGILGYRSNEK